MTLNIKNKAHLGFDWFLRHGQEHARPVPIPWGRTSLCVTVSVERLSFPFNTSKVSVLQTLRDQSEGVDLMRHERS